MSSTSLTGMQSASTRIGLTGNGTASGALLQGVSPPRGITITEASSAEWPDPPVSASCTDSAVPGVSFGTLVGSQLLIPVERAGPGADLRCTFVNIRGESLYGRVFSDIGTGATPNDGVPGGAEPGLPGILVTLGDCQDHTLASIRSDGAGNYRLPVPSTVAAGSPLCVQVPADSSRRPTGASVGSTALALGSPVSVAGQAFTYRRDAASERIALVWPGAGAARAGSLNFASVPFGSFLPNGLKIGRPGAVVSYPHSFTAPSGGTLGFTVVSPADGWLPVVFADPGCSGKKPTNAALWFPPASRQTVTAGQVVCLVLQTTIPAQAPTGSRNDIVLLADFVFTNASPALSATYQVDDVTTVSAQTLELVKEVRNLTQGVAEFGVSNQARPGDTLEYRIRYSNLAPTPINFLDVTDTTPAHTSFVAADVQDTPAELTACSKTTPATHQAAGCNASETPGGTGGLEWIFTGSLPPGGSGAVRFQVKVD